MKMDKPNANPGKSFGDNTNIAITELTSVAKLALIMLPDWDKTLGVIGLFSYILQNSGVEQSPFYNQIMQDIQNIDDACLNNSVSIAENNIEDIVIQMAQLSPIDYTSYCEAMSNQIPNLVFDPLSNAVNDMNMPNFKENYSLIFGAGGMCTALNFCFPQEISGSLASNFNNLAYLVSQVNPTQTPPISSSVCLQILSTISTIESQLATESWYKPTWGDKGLDQAAQ